jgi:RimJ/RimL family protein N-acetyltransferase
MAPWLRDTLRSAADVEKFIALWLQNFAKDRGFCAGVWFEGLLSGMIYHANVDWADRSAALSYWLDEAHQGKGIMTASYRAFVSHAFDTWKMNRIVIECAVDNARSRAIPERLGFTLEGIIREPEWGSTTATSITRSMTFWDRIMRTMPGNLRRTRRCGPQKVHRESTAAVSQERTILGRKEIPCREYSSALSEKFAQVRSLVIRLKQPC